MNILMNIITKLKFKLLLSLKIIIYLNIDIIINLIWRFNEIINRMIIYQIIKEYNHDSDYLLIKIIIIIWIKESQ